MSVPAVLIQRGVQNESQETELKTVKLFPNSTNNYQSRWQFPNQGTIIDSNSALVFSIDWAGYLAANTTELCSLKQFSGGLNCIRRARLYVGGVELLSNEDVANVVHVNNLTRNPDYQEEITDLEIGSQHGFYDSSDAKYQVGPDAPSRVNTTVSGVDGIISHYKRYARALGSYSTTATLNKSIECSVLLTDIFSALQSIQLPPDELGAVVLEIDWETEWDEVAMVLSDPSSAITAGRKVINIQNPVLLLDYLTFDDESKAGLSDALMNGVAIPYLHNIITTANIAENANTETQSVDIQLALQGKLLMKILVSHRFSDYNKAGDTIQPPYLANGRCRSQRGNKFEYNLVINDLAIHDSNVDTASQQYSYFSMAQQSPSSVIPGGIEYNNVYTAAIAASDVNAGAYICSGVALPQAGLGVADTTIRDMIANTQAWTGFRLAKSPQGSGARGGVVIPSDAGYRSGATPVILRISQTTGAADTQESRPKTVEVIAQEVRVLQVRGKVINYVEA